MAGTRIPIFDLGAAIYDWLTDQPLWKGHIARLLDHMGERKDALRVLDLGCGPGNSTFVLAEKLGPSATLMGVDLSRLMIQRARKHHARSFDHLGNVRFERADATALPFADDSFDLVVGHSFLYLVPDRVAVLREIRRVLVPGGRLVLMEPHRDVSLPAALRHTLADPALRDTGLYDRSRFLASMVLWRVVSSAAGKMHARQIERLFAEGGFEHSYCERTLGGLGLHCVGY